MHSRSPSRHPTGFIEPCLPTPSRIVPAGPRWAFEVKHDGYRFIARRDGDRVRVFSRHGKDWTDKVPAIVEGMLALPVSATVDGEGVVCDERGVTYFDKLRTSLAVRGGSRAVFLYGFDLLAIDGQDLRRHPWEIRRCCARPAQASGFPSTSTATARPSSDTRRFAPPDLQGGAPHLAFQSLPATSAVGVSIAE